MLKAAVVVEQEKNNLGRWEETFIGHILYFKPYNQSVRDIYYKIAVNNVHVLTLYCLS